MEVDLNKEDIKFKMLFPLNPQSAIIEGIPVQRAEISTRNFSQKALHNLYVLTEKFINNVSLNDSIEVQCGSRSFTILPHGKQAIADCPELLI